MPNLPKPIFESYESFIDQDFSLCEPTMACVHAYIESFEPSVEAPQGYLIARNFLRAYSGNSLTFTSYRTHVERLLLWALIVKGKPLRELKRRDAEDYLQFCRNPPVDWIGPVVRGRFVSDDHSESTWGEPTMPNAKWRPFSMKKSKAMKHADGEPDDPVDLQYTASQGTINQVYSISTRFFEYLVEEGAVAGNPFRLIKKKGANAGTPQDEGAHRALTPLQWDYVVETAEKMALADPERHERTLFILATLFAMYLRVSDVVGRPNWTPVMGNFRQDAEGNWWYHVVGKGNKVGKIAMRDEYIEQYLKRYRRFLGLPLLPQWDEKTPLLSTLRGRSGLSGRQVRALLQAVFDNAVNSMRDEGRQPHEMHSLKAASAHWLRHTSATFDAPLRSAKDLQLDLRHSNLSTTQNVYYHSHDQERSKSVKRVRMRDRG